MLVNGLAWYAVFLCFSVSNLFPMQLYVVSCAFLPHSFCFQVSGVTQNPGTVAEFQPDAIQGQPWRGHPVEEVSSEQRQLRLQILCFFQVGIFHAKHDGSRKQASENKSNHRGSFALKKCFLKKKLPKEMVYHQNVWFAVEKFSYSAKNFVWYVKRCRRNSKIDKSWVYIEYHEKSDLRKISRIWAWGVSRKKTEARSRIFPRIKGR